MRSAKHEARRIVHDVLRELAEGEGSKAELSRAELEARREASHRALWAVMEAEVARFGDLATSPLLEFQRSVNERELREDRFRHAFLGS